jgi:hypothetical protein
MTGVDQFTAEFAYLAVGEVAAQAEHASADAFLRLVQLHADAGLAQAPRGRQAGHACADDDYVVATSGMRQRHLRAGRQGQRGGGSGRLLHEAAARVQRAQFALTRDRLVERFAGKTCLCRNRGRASEEVYEWCPGHAVSPLSN